MKGKIIIAGIGPGSPDDITPAVLHAVREADAVVGYKYYFQFVTPYLKAGCECIDTGMKRERDRAEQAFLLAQEGKTVVVSPVVMLASTAWPRSSTRCSRAPAVPKAETSILP